MPEPARRLYDEDFYLWTQDQAQALRRLAAERWNGPLDLEHLAEEVEDLGSEQKHAVRSQLIRILEHFLKLAHSPSPEPRLGWQKSIANARNEIEHRLTRSIRRQLEPELGDLYEKARYNAELDLRSFGEDEAARALPSACPYSWDDLLRDRWYPDGPGG